MHTDPSLYHFHWLTAERWPDLERLFGPKGACAGCWCMFWRLRGKAFDEGCGEPNHRAFQTLVLSDQEPGILAYNAQNEPVGWIALAPREDYPRLAHSKVLAPVDETPVWSITCFFVTKSQRKQGLTLALLQAAVKMAGEKGATVLEGYPIEPKGGRTADAFVYTGLASTFRRAGFSEVARRSETRPVMRFHIQA